jgi:hypothetical protein
MFTITGEMLNEMSTWDELRQVLARSLKVDVFQGDLDTILEDSVVWVESATSTNLPSGATQGFLETKTAIVNGQAARVQRFDGTDGTNGVSSVRYMLPGGNVWLAWS